MKKLMAAVLAGLMLAGLLSGCASTANDEKVEYRWKMALNSTEGEIILLSLIQCRGIIKKCSFAV